MRRNHGFTLLEVTMVSGLMVLLAMLLASAWASVGKLIVDLIVRTQVAQEMDFAVAALSRDLGGALVGAPGDPPSASQSPTWDNGGDGTKLNLYFADHKVTYEMDSHRLIRRDLNTTNGDETAFTVAANLDDLQVLENGDEITVRVDFGCYYAADTLRARALEKRTFVLKATKPST